MAHSHAPPPGYSEDPAPAAISSTSTPVLQPNRPDADAFIRSFIPTPGNEVNEKQYPRGQLPIPLCIPQISVNGNFDSSFARGYSPALESVGITQETFLKFIDGLNLAITSSPPLRVVDVAGAVLGFVPHEWAWIAGAVMQFVAQNGMYILSKSLSDRYLRAANLELFQPRGLSVRLCTTPAMLALLTDGTQATGETRMKEELTKVGQVGRRIGTFLLKNPYVVPFGNSLVRAIADKPQKLSATGVEGDPINKPVFMRRLALTEGLALPLQMEGMPPPFKPSGIMDTMNSWGVKLDDYLEGRAEKTVEKRRRVLKRLEEEEAMRNAARMSGQRSPPSMVRHSSSSSVVQRTTTQASYMTDYRDVKKAMKKEEKMMKLQMKAERREAKEIKKQDKKAYKKKRKMKRLVADADLLESWATDKCLWVVIMEAEKDTAIKGIEIAENSANEEHIDSATWQAEMELEREELQDELMSESASDSGEDEEPEHERKEEYDEKRSMPVPFSRAT